MTREREEGLKRQSYERHVAERGCAAMQRDEEGENVAP